MKFFSFIVFLFFISKFNAQNLVPNGSFEDYKKCPEKHQRFADDNWHGPDSWYRVGCTADYFNKCSKNMSVPKNAAGDQEARTGSAYAGLILWDKSSENHREYIEVKLNDSLKKNEMYCVKFYVSLADSSSYETSCIGAVLSKVHNDNLAFCGGNLHVFPQIKNDTKEYISNDSDWVEISGIYKTIGGEQYITLGNFMGAKEDRTRKRMTGYQAVRWPFGGCAYYYIDDVSVIRITNENDCSGLLAAKPIVLKNVFFETGKSVLLPKSFPELNTLVNSLKKDSKANIEITGHTDNIGKEENNIKLSRARAKTVGDYLISKEIDKKRISCKGYGSSKPIAGNDTEQGKQKNRRVEFILK